mgnify:CR=1 FL=1
MDFNKLSSGAKLALIGGAVLVINLFMPWYSFDFGIVSASINGLDAGFLAWGGSLIAIAGAVILLLKAMGKNEVNAGQFKTEQLAFGLGAIGFVLVVLRFRPRRPAPRSGCTLESPLRPSWPGAPFRR